MESLMAYPISLSELGYDKCLVKVLDNDLHTTKNMQAGMKIFATVVLVGMRRYEDICEGGLVKGELVVVNKSKLDSIDGIYFSHGISH